MFLMGCPDVAEEKMYRTKFAACDAKFHMFKVGRVKIIKTVTACVHAAACVHA